MFEEEEFNNLEPEKPPVISLSEQLKDALTGIEDEVIDALTVRDQTLGAWNPRMVFDIALGVEDDEIVRGRYLLDEDEYRMILQQPAFKKEVAILVKEIRESGVSFATKAKLIAEETLTDIFNIITSTHVAAKDRVTAWTKVAEFAGLTPKVEKGDNGLSHQVNIQINL
jgi:hypothetical protein